ncbi:unnamed protein product [Calypogeia fissa]
MTWQGRRGNSGRVGLTGRGCRERDEGAGRQGEAEGGRPTEVGSRRPKKGTEEEIEKGVVVGGAAEGRAERRGGGAECVVVVGEDVEFDGLIDEWQISSTEQIGHREKEITISKHRISYLLLLPPYNPIAISPSFCSEAVVEEIATTRITTVRSSRSTGSTGGAAEEDEVGVERNEEDEVEVEGKRGKQGKSQGGLRSRRREK